MTGKRADSGVSRVMKRSLNGRILRNTTLNILVLVVICCVIMAASLQSLANSILLDSLQPMARQSAKTVEANIHMLADRMMGIAVDPRMTGEAAAPGETAAGRAAVLEEAAELYELYTIALYDLDGRLVQGIARGSGQCVFRAAEGNGQSDHRCLHPLSGQAGHHHGDPGEGERRNRPVPDGRL